MKIFHPRRKDEDQPDKIVADKAYFPLRCDGNGNPAKAAQSTTCLGMIPANTVIYLAHWRTSPHQTVHCKSCREHFFGQQRLSF